MYNMLMENDFIHPITMEPISDDDISRAKKLIDLYQTKIGLLRRMPDTLSPEYKLRTDSQNYLNNSTATVFTWKKIGF